MPSEAPRGYRFLKHDDNKQVLDENGLLEGFCRCGHTASEHEGNDGGGRCRICECNLFHYRCALVELDTPATPVVFQPATPQPAA